MPDETQALEPTELSLDDVMAECIAAEEAGRVLDRSALVARYPQHAAELREFFANRDRMQRLAGPLRGGNGHAPAGTKLRYFGDYELLEEIAVGGMGIVYKARQVSLNRVVAVKMILKGTLASEDDVKRFRAEAEAAASLQHPGIVAIHEVGLHEGQHYFSMDFVEGQSLAQLPREQPLPASQAAEYVRDAAEAVHYAHQQGTLHRDLKPSNILIDRQGRVRITDFGLAKRIEGQSDLTLTGQILGTPSYMPPEQALSKRSLIGTASDVYSLGAVLYELLAGRPPFRGESPAETLRQVETLDPISPCLLSPTTPRDLETICLKCLEKEPHKRYPTAQLLADDLGRFLRHEPIHARPTTQRERAWRWCRRHPVVSALSAAILLLLVATTVASLIGFYWMREALAEAVQRQEAQDDLQIHEAIKLLDSPEPDFHGSERSLTDALVRRPKDASIYLHRGRARWESGAAALALEDARHSIELQPTNNSAARLLVVEAALELGNTALARQTAAELEQRAAASAEALAARAVIEPQAANSLELLNQAITNQPRNPQYLALRGRVAYQRLLYLSSRRHYEQATADLEAALQLRPHDWRARQQLAACHVLFHMFAATHEKPLDRAKQRLNAWLAQSPNDPAALVLLARWHLEQEQPAEALAVCERPSAAARARPDVAVQYAEALRRLNRRAEAEQVLTEAEKSLETEPQTSIQPITRRLLIALKSQIVIERGTLASAALLLEEFRTLPEEPAMAHQEWLELATAWARLAEGQSPSPNRRLPVDPKAAAYSVCVQLCEAWTKLAPESPGPYQVRAILGDGIAHHSTVLQFAPSARWPLYHRGVMYASIKSDRLAKADFEAFLSHFPGHPQGEFALASVLMDSTFRSIHDPVKAAELARGLVARDPEQWEYWHLLARIEHLLQNDGVALPAIERAFAKNPGNEQQALLRTEILLRLGRWSEVRPVLERVLQARGRTPERLASLARVLALRPSGTPQDYELALAWEREAQAMFAQEVASGKRRPDAYRRRTAESIALFRLGRYAESLACGLPEEQDAFIRVMALWQAGSRDQAWALYQQQSRLVARDLAMLDRRQSQWSELRREAARTIGAQLGPELVEQDLATRGVGPADYPQWGGWAGRNNVSLATRGPTDWNIGEFDRKTGAWKSDKARNVKWVAPLGSISYGNPAVASGRIFIGTNNSNGYLRRYQADVDLGCLIALRESDGSFLWQHSSEKLPTGRVHDWPLMGCCSAPLVEGDRLWFVTNRGEVRCLDVQGFHDGEDDGREASAEPARLFDVVPPWNNPNKPPAKDFLPEMLAELEACQLGTEWRRRFASAGVELPADLELQKETTTGNVQRWTFQAVVGGLLRDFHLEHAGRRLSAFRLTTTADKEEADVVWVVNMMTQLGVSQHNMCTCAPTAWGDKLFICTSNGVDEAHSTIPAPQAPSFIALDKRTGRVLWTDNSPGKNIHHGQWSAPAVGVFAGVPQVIFGGGDGWVYSFHADHYSDGKPQLLWKCDTNPKDAVLEIGGRGTRDEPIAVPVIYDGYVYVTNGQDPEHGEGQGHLWCIDPTRRDDVSPQLAVHVSDRNKVLPHRRKQAIDPDKGEMAIDNPNSAVVWHYSRLDANTDLKIDFEEEFHRAISSVVIKNDVLLAVDFSGLAHCLNAKTGRRYWTCDLLAAGWGTPLVIGDRAYVPDEDGDIAMFELHPDPERSSKVSLGDGDSPSFNEPLHEINMGNSVYSTPVFANGVLYIATKDHLFAIAEPPVTNAAPP